MATDPSDSGLHLYVPVDGRHRGLLAEGNASVRASRAKPRTDDLAYRRRTVGAGAWGRGRVVAALGSVAAMASLGVFTVTANGEETLPPAPQAVGVSEAGAEAKQAPPGPAPVSVPGRNLVLIDVSASMGERAEPGPTWLQAATQAVAAGVGPAHEATEVGIWLAGSRFQDERDWAAVLSVGPLGEQIGPTTRRQLIQSNLGQVGAMPGDRLGLYDAVLAAFRAMNSTYQPDRSNAVTVFTDGGNDDPAGITLENLVATLGREFDPIRPVHVNIIGYGDKADHDALTRIADATRGGMYAVVSPQQALEHFQTSMSHRA